MSVTWGDFSLLEAQQSCLADLLASPVAWRYAISLAGSEQVQGWRKEQGQVSVQVLRTNRELVELLSSSPQPEIYAWAEDPRLNTLGGKFAKQVVAGRTGSLPPPPHNMTPMYGGNVGYLHVHLEALV